MELTGRQTIAADQQTTWAALNDPEVLKQCITGCEAIEQTGPDQYQLQLAVKVGPVNARFKARLSLENVVPPVSYTLRFDGQGGAAGFGKGSADVRLSPDTEGTLLEYTARAQVGGRIAQIGSRLVDATARKMADEFFACFNARVSGPAGGEPAAAPLGTPGAPAAMAAPAGVASGAAAGLDRDPGISAGALAGAQTPAGDDARDAGGRDAAAPASDGPLPHGAAATGAATGIAGASVAGVAGSPAAAAPRAGPGASGGRPGGVWPAWVWALAVVAIAAVVAIFWN